MSDTTPQVVEDLYEILANRLTTDHLIDTPVEAKERIAVQLEFWLSMFAPPYE